MNTIFDSETRDNLILRINSLKENSTSSWGKMNLFQMLKHCNTWDTWILGMDNAKYKQAFIGKLFGKMGLKRIMRPDSILDKNTPTSPRFVIKEERGDVIALQQSWIDLIRKYEFYNNPEFIHDFFGKMTKDQIGIMAYKHNDHHLRQFGA